jgi:hypothetical protein
MQLQLGTRGVAFLRGEGEEEWEGKEEGEGGRPEEPRECDPLWFPSRAGIKMCFHL